MKSTALYFGSAVVAKSDQKNSELRLGILFIALLGFHKAYSRALLALSKAALEPAARSE